MGSRLKRMVLRAQYAAIGAALGAAAGGLLSRNAASTGGALGALAGATIGEKRIDVSDTIAQVKGSSDEAE